MRDATLVLIDILRTHPVAVIGDAPHANPFFSPPAEFLVEMFARRQRRRKR